MDFKKDYFYITPFEQFSGYLNETSKNDIFKPFFLKLKNAVSTFLLLNADIKMHTQLLSPFTI